jgi:hypothetical protein
MAHGPGIKLVNGLAEASTNGDTIYTYRCRARFLTPTMPGLVPSQFLTVMPLAPPAGNTREEETRAKRARGSLTHHLDLLEAHLNLQGNFAIVGRITWGECALQV